ncbi:hypothetical protein Syun_003968 [Stephania yunnanensis]|uniref:Protein kinase domain-containing protein n=1 Tax=Stephania yunnanensis TaxID=152371 RepID=A0AAP0L2F4_9MAGN
MHLLQRFIHFNFNLNGNVWLWLLLWFVCSSSRSFSVVKVNGGSEKIDERRALLEFKKGIREDPLGRVLDTWNLSSEMEADGCPESWHGIFCEDTGSVTAIVLDGLGLVGDLKFNNLIGLKMLRNLSLSGNFLTGRLVPAMGVMATLQYLDLSRNRFYGPIPGRISDLWGLHYLNLSSNNFTGGFPDRLDNLQQLKVFDAHSNRLTGEIGDLLSDLRNVEHVDLSDNYFYGGLALSSENISSLSNTLRHFNLSNNKLKGEFLSGDSMQLFRNLNVLDLSNNQLTGMISSFASLLSLQILRIGNNELYGSIPEELFGSLVPLEEMDLSGNGFSGSLPSINSTTLKVLNLSSNMLSGSLPSTFGGLIRVDLSGNTITGDISVMQSWGESLEVIHLSSNALSGSIENLKSQFAKLISINISNNSLIGCLPLELGVSPKLLTVDLSFNEFDGSIPSSLFTSMTLTNLNLSGNHLIGIIPFQGSRMTELLVLSSSPMLESLDLSDNSLTGPLPSEISKFERLRLLNLGKNGLSGQLPIEISKLDGLKSLDLSRNNFKGKIPDNLPSSLVAFNVSNNDFSGTIPENLRNFPISSFRPGNKLLIFPGDTSPNGERSGETHGRGRHGSKASVRVAIIVASIGAAVMIAFVLLAYYRAKLHEFHGRNGFGDRNARLDVNLGIFSRPSLFKFHRSTDPPPTSLSFSNDHLLTSSARSISGQKDFVIETVERGLAERNIADSSIKPDLLDNPSKSEWRSSPGSPTSPSPHLVEVCEQPMTLNVYSPDRFSGELFFLDSSIVFTAEELSHAPAEVLGRSSHGTLYKATLNNGHMLTVKWLRVGLVKRKKEFAKEAKKIGSIRHPNVVSLRAYYWGPREQERLILADYIHGDSLALHLYETTPRRYSRLTFTQRLKISMDVARGLCHLHDRGLSHGDLKPTNILLSGPELTAQLTDYSLHRLMTPPGTSEQLLNLGALGYGAPELTATAKPLPSIKADVYAFGVILMELLTRRSAGDIISGQSGAVDLTDWVRLCAQEGRGIECFDRDIAGGDEHSKAMDELLLVSLKCILTVNERPSIRSVFEDLCSISV